MSGRAARLEVTALGGVPDVRPGDDLATIICDALGGNDQRLKDGDVLVIAQKIVSKAEGRYVDLATVTPSARAVELARRADKDPRLVELILGESAEVLRHRPGVLIVVHRQGYVLANAGIDASNVDPTHGAEPVLLLPEDPDRSAAVLRAELGQRSRAAIAVIINDSLGRAWRMGTVGVALGSSGLAARLDLRGQADMYGRELRITEIGLADEIASAASLVMGQGDERYPLVLVRGVPYAAGDGTAADLVRPKDLDLFR